MEIKEIANLKFQCDDLDRKITVKEYLKELLLELWTEAECFSGKRPFGNSDWQYDIYQVLIKNKIISGALDEDDYIDEFDRDDADAADEIIKKVIKQL